ncbi:4Fe-4S binding protein [Candidatus Latescibacterota bacterium]
MKRRDFMKTTAAAGAGLTHHHHVPAVESADKYYDKLADALDKLPNAFPRTKSNIELQILKKIFTPQDAWIAGQLTIKMDSIVEIARRTGLPEKDTRDRLADMRKRNIILGGEKTGYRLKPFIIGFWESQLDTMDHELSHLFELYMDEGGAELMKHNPPIHRVIPAQSAVKKEMIIPYDDLHSMMQSSKSFILRDCICRKQQDQIGERKCDYPLNVELIFFQHEIPESPLSISKERALEVLDETENIGLVHTVRNTEKGVYYTCNCCGCCCGLLRGITEWGIENSVAYANYYSVIDPDDCTGCGKCVERCQVKAISKQGDVAVVEREKCIGCGLCVTGCQTGVAKLEKKPDSEIINPPKDFATWEQDRMKNRGLI